MAGKGDPGPDKGLEKGNEGPARCNENKSRACASGHCCGRQSARRLPVSRYFGDN